jgi:divalent metal cation (Fe/Co/Zn/Cd) transporter
LPARGGRFLIIAVTFFALARLREVDAVLDVLRADRPSVSPLGLVVTGAAVVVMLALAWAKRRTAKELNEHGREGRLYW